MNKELIKDNFEKLPAPKNGFRISPIEQEHYGIEIAEFLACANGLTDFLFKHGDFGTAMIFNCAITDTLNNLGNIKKKKYRTSMFFMNAAIAAINMRNFTATLDFINAAKVDIKEKGSGTLNLKKLDNLERDALALQKEAQTPAAYIG